MCERIQNNHLIALNKEFTKIPYDSTALGHKVQTEHYFEHFCDYFFWKSVFDLKFVAVHWCRCLFVDLEWSFFLLNSEKGMFAYSSVMPA